MSYNTTHQHEPLRAPANWGMQERFFVAQLETLFDQIYSWKNRYQLKDFKGSAIEMVNPSDSAQKIIVGKNSSGDFGLWFSKDGGTTWVMTIGFDGIDVFSGGSITFDTLSDFNLSGGTFTIDTPYFRITKDDEERAVLDEDGNFAVNAGFVKADHFIGDVVNSYGGSTTITVDGSIQTVIDNLPKHLSYDVTISVPEGTYNEDLTIKGFIGAGIVLSLDSAATVNGTVIIENCMDVTIDGGKFVGVIADYTMAISNVQSIYMYDSIISGKTRTSAPDSAAYCLIISGCNGVLSGVDLQRADTGILAVYSCLMLDALTGGETGGDYTSLALLEYGVGVAYGAHCGYQTSIPTGEVGDSFAANATLTGSGTPTESPNAAPDPMPTGTEYASTAYQRMRDVQVRTGTGLSTASISWGGWTHSSYSDWSTNKPRQGTATGAITVSSQEYVSGVGIVYTYRQERYLHYGAWITPAVSDLSSVTAATLTITRDAEQGSTGTAVINVYSHNYTTAPTGHNYSALTDTGLSVTLARGGSETIALDATTLAALKAGTIKGFGLYSSGNYAQMTASATLNVTY